MRSCLRIAYIVLVMALLGLVNHVSSVRRQCLCVMPSITMHLALYKTFCLWEILVHVRRSFGMYLSLQRTLPPRRHVTVATVKVAHVIESLHHLSNGCFPKFASKISASLL